MLKVIIGIFATLYAVFAWALCRAAGLRDQEEMELFDEYDDQMFRNNTNK